MKIYLAMEIGYYGDKIYGIFSTKEQAYNTILKSLENETEKNMTKGCSVLEYINECITTVDSVEEYINSFIHEFELDKPTNEDGD